MHHFGLTLSCIALGGLMALDTALAQGPTHPGYDRQEVTFADNKLFTTQSKNGNLPLVGGMDVFPDGRVAFVEWGVPGSVFILGASIGQSSANVPITRFARGLNSAMGLKIVNNSIYVMEKEGLTQLVDTNSDGRADEYNSINQSFPSNNSMLNLSYDVGYADNAFYAALSSDVAIGGYDFGSAQQPGSQAFPGRSTLYKLNPDGTSSAFACGFRNPNGMDINGTDIFVTDNQGSWLPSSKLILVKQGKFYGHRTNPTNACQTQNNNTETPPVAWSNFGDNNSTATGRSWGNPVVLRNAPYAGQILIGELVTGHVNNIVRVFMQEVGGEVQGVILPFVKASTTKGVHRIKEGKNGELYLGILGSDCCWGPRSGMTPGFDVMRPNKSTSYLEVLAIRSMGNNSFELEFNKPVGTGAGQANAYTITQWQNIPSETYGGGNIMNKQTLSVTGATVASNKVTLTINGLQTGRVVRFDLGNGVTAQDGSALWTQFAVYTLNRFGPGTDYKLKETTGVEDIARQANTGWSIARTSNGHSLRFSGNVAAAKDVTLFDIQGKLHLEKRGVLGNEIPLETGRLSKGMYWVRVNEAGKISTRSFMLP